MALIAETTRSNSSPVRDRRSRERGASNPRSSSAARAWPIRGAGTAHTRAELALWRPLLDEVAYFEHAKFYPIAGAFTDIELYLFPLTEKTPPSPPPTAAAPEYLEFADG